MNELELRIKTQFEKNKHLYLERIDTDYKDCKIETISFPIMVDGVIDEILYNTKDKTFTAIYQVGVGDYYIGDELNAFFDEVEYRTLKL